MFSVKEEVIKKIRAFSLRIVFSKQTDSKQKLFFQRIHTLDSLFSPKCEWKRNYKQTKRLQRTSFGISLHGSLTIEAAIIIPLFLFAVLSILSFTDMLRLQIRMDSAMENCAKELAVYGHAKDIDLGGVIGSEGLGNFNGITQGIFSETYVRQKVLKDVGKDYLANSVAHPEQIHFLGSKIMEKDRIELHSSYYAKPLFSISPYSGFITGETAVARAFTGYDFSDDLMDNQQKDEYVYVTVNGTVYHRDRGCPYLDLSISKAYASDVSHMRNHDGGIYRPCQSCKPGKNGGTVVFITDYGDRYHSDLLCSGLRRTVEMVKLSEVGGKGPCSKCGY